MSKYNGLILYKGPSQLDGKPIVVIATKNSENRKTGKMIQTWIIRSDISPVLARRLGDDKSVCGDCKHRDFGTCYVIVGQAPNSVYQAYHRDKYVLYNFYDESHINFLKGCSLRIGSYGDPAAVPLEVWEEFCSLVKDWTGYTHQWKYCVQKLRCYFMASCDTEQERELALEMGWRTFRIRLPEQPILFNEFICPASKESSTDLYCNECGACCGTFKNNKNTPVIIIHGNNACVNREELFRKGLKKIKNKKKWRIDFKSRNKIFKQVCKIG